MYSNKILGFLSKLIIKFGSMSWFIEDSQSIYCKHWLKLIVLKYLIKIAGSSK